MLIRGQLGDSKNSEMTLVKPAVLRCFWAGTNGRSFLTNSIMAGRMAMKVD
jgi:hypothetical protein